MFGFLRQFGAQRPSGRAVNTEAPRNIAIAASVQGGESIQTVAARHGISRQRVSQIIHAFGVRYERPRGQPIKHGGPARYRAGCRCVECRAWNARKSREQYRRRHS